MDQHELTTTFPIGTVVVHKGHGAAGTVTSHGNGTLFVAWVNTFVEDEVHPADVDVKPDPTPQESAWRGGIGFVNEHGSLNVRPAESRSDPDAAVPADEQQATS